MNLDAVITQLRTYCPVLGGRVAGAADFEKGVEPVVSFTAAGGALQYPSAVVIPLDFAADPPDEALGLAQSVVEMVGVVVEFDASADRRGQGAVNQVHDMAYALHAALLNWRIDPDRAARGLYFVEGRPLLLDRARVFWRYVYALDVTLTDGDGFQLRGDPLTDVEGQIEVTTDADAPLINVQLYPAPEVT